MTGPSSVFDESVVFRRTNKKSTSQKQSEKTSSGTKLAEKGRKRIFQERKGEGKVGSRASRKERQLENVKVETSEHLDLLNS